MDCSDGPPLVGWRLFRVRRAADGPVLAAPLIHNPDFEEFPSRAIVARCYEHDHRAPAPTCRCGLYAAIEGTLDSLPGYLLDSAHDHDPALYAEVACSGRLFVDRRGIRAERIEVLRLAASPSARPAGPPPPSVQKSRFSMVFCTLGGEEVTVTPWAQRRQAPHSGRPRYGSVINLSTRGAKCSSG